MTYTRARLGQSESNIAPSLSPKQKRLARWTKHMKRKSQNTGTVNPIPPFLQLPQVRQATHDSLCRFVVAHLCNCLLRELKGIWTSWYRIFEFRLRCDDAKEIRHMATSRLSRSFLAFVCRFRQKFRFLHNFSQWKGILIVAVTGFPMSAKLFPPHCCAVPRGHTGLVFNLVRLVCFGQWWDAHLSLCFECSWTSVWS